MDLKNHNHVVQILKDVECFKDVINEFLKYFFKE